MDVKEKSKQVLGAEETKKRFSETWEWMESTKHMPLTFCLSILMQKADTIAFGDAKVDIPMFKYCEQSVCLGNGGDEAKEAADMVTQAVDDDGLASAFHKLGLI